MTARNNLNGLIRLIGLRAVSDAKFSYSVPHKRRERNKQIS